jgi:hypothetical protein
MSASLLPVRSALGEGLASCCDLGHHHRQTADGANGGIGPLAAVKDLTLGDWRTSLCDVPPGFLHVGPARWGFPYVPAWPRLGNAPPLHLFYLVASAAAGAGVAGTRLSALVVGDGVFEV